MSEITARKLSLAVKAGFDRLKTYRRARAMFIKTYVPQYYSKMSGITGELPINLIFNAIRVTIPNIIMKNPLNKVVTEIIPYKRYAETLSLGLDFNQKKMKLKNILRAGTVDTFFGMGIYKTGISQSGQVLNEDNRFIDPGQLYTDIVDLDNFTMDPTCFRREEATFLGDRIRVPRQILLDMDGVNHDLVLQLPKYNVQTGSDKGIHTLTQTQLQSIDVQNLQDFVYVVEIFVPKANAVAIIPDPYVKTFDEFLSIKDFYGPDDGPYTFETLTPVVPNNPLPIAPVGVWYDLADAANRMFKKIMDQADRQRDVVVFDPAQSDTAQDILDADDGEYIAAQDPKAVNVLSLGGQRKENEGMMNQLQLWFNYMSGNPDQMAGLKSDANTATQADILYSNANIGIEDTKQIIYDTAADISSKQAWYMHNDPLLRQILCKRNPGDEQEQIILTPEQQEGDWLDYSFEIVPKSMAILNPQIRSKRLIEFATNLLPAAASTAMLMLQMGVPFNLQGYITMMAEELDIGPWVQDLFNDPQFTARLELMMAMGPQPAGKGNPTSAAGVRQNKGFPGKTKIRSLSGQVNSQRQQGGALRQEVYDAIRN
uniref:Uncharacterized protein n=1 Tax=viral metagenome TaxID=1070528 RepID=A0A6M3KU80_9ZZZZ